MKILEKHIFMLQFVLRFFFKIVKRLISGYFNTADLPNVIGSAGILYITSLFMKQNCVTGV
jgi:hypothetical protein